MSEILPRVLLLERGQQCVVPESVRVKLIRGLVPRH